jgi:hypothetical protein
MGVVLGLLITQPPLGTVMSGVGACRVNNDIVRSIPATRCVGGG